MCPPGSLTLIEISGFCYDAIRTPLSHTEQSFVSAGLLPLITPLLARHRKHRPFHTHIPLPFPLCSPSFFSSSFPIGQKSDRSFFLFRRRDLYMALPCPVPRDWIYVPWLRGLSSAPLEFKFNLACPTFFPLNSPPFPFFSSRKTPRIWDSPRAEVPLSPLPQGIRDLQLRAALTVCAPSFVRPPSPSSRDHRKRLCRKSCEKCVRLACTPPPLNVTGNYP